MNAVIRAKASSLKSSKLLYSLKSLRNEVLLEKTLMLRRVSWIPEELYACKTSTVRLGKHLLD